MWFHRFINKPELPVHSSGYAKAAQGDRMGATSQQSYSSRLRKDKNRQVIAQYRQSKVGSQRVYSPAKPVDSDTAVSQSRAVPPVQNVPPPVQKPGKFQEPPSRGYNPYK